MGVDQKIDNHVGTKRNSCAEKRGTMRSATKRNGQLEGHCPQVKIDQEHSENHSIHEDGVSGQIFKS